MRVSDTFIQEKLAEKVRNDDFWGRKPLKLVWKQSVFLDLSGLGNYVFLTTWESTMIKVVHFGFFTC